MTTHEVRLETSGRGGKIEIDGIDLSNITKSVDIHAQGGKFGEVVLTLAATRKSEVTGQYEVNVDEKTRDALIALGWVPPAKEEAS